MPVEVTKDLLTTISKLPKGKQRKAMALLGQQEWRRCADDVMYWLDPARHADVPYVYTFDKRQMFNCNLCHHPVLFTTLVTHLETFHEMMDVVNHKQYFTELPTTLPFTIKEYMPPIIDAWLNNQLVAVEKSRDMMATWLIVTLYAWDAFFHTREIVFQSDDAAKTIDLVERAWFIFQHQPKFLRIHRGTFTSGQSKSGQFTIPTLGSKILGFPQGPDQIRYMHPAGIFMDEAAYQILAEEAFTAVKPAIQAGGRCTLVSSANPGFFQAVCRDLTHV